MLLDAAINTANLIEAAFTSLEAERLGFDAIWTQEIKHDPYLPLSIVSGETKRLHLGTAVALAFPRSPTVTAQIAWDLARASNGRFILGLGTQVKAHIERRFAAAWNDTPASQLRDYIGAVRAVWHSWRSGDRLRYLSPSYNLRLMTPFFTPEPLEVPDPPIYVAGVNQRLCTLAGELCDGFHVHPFHTPTYVRKRVLPWIEAGLLKSGRERQSFSVSATVFVVTGGSAEREIARENVRRQLAFYASTPSYRTLLDLHGWGDVAPRLTKLASRGNWADMPALVTDSMLSHFAIEASSLAQAVAALRPRYGNDLDRVTFYLPFVAGERDAEWRDAIETAHSVGPTF